MSFLNISPAISFLRSIYRHLTAAVILPVLFATGNSVALASTGAGTTTTLTLTVGGTTPYLIGPNTPVTLTVAVNAGLPVTAGRVLICQDLQALHCPATSVVAIAQLTSAGTAIVHVAPSPGSRAYQALFLGTNSLSSSVSNQAYIAVTGVTDSARIFFDGEPGGASTLQGTVTGSLAVAPTGTVSFIDTTDSNNVLGTATLGAGTKHFSFLTSDRPTFGTGSFTAAGDFNGDGFLDIAAVNDNLGNLTVYTGHGDGTFTNGTPFATCSAPGPLATGDFNEDGKLDLAVSCFGSVTILLGNGDGTFSAGANLPAGSGSYSLVVTDFNGDGHADLAEANTSTNDVTILLGHGDGTFNATASNPATSANPRAATVGDFNGDGKADLILSTTGGGGTLTLLLGNGDGTFTTGTTPLAGAIPIGIAVGDFDFDNKLDLVVGDSSTSTLTILHGNGDGTFTPLPAHPATGSVPSTILIADIDEDGLLDIVVGNETDQTVTALINNGNGTFGPGLTQHAYYGGGTLPYALAADFNNDGKPDILIGVAQGTAALDLLLSQSSESAVATMPLVSPVGTGVHSIVASYPGNGLYGPVTSDPTGLTASPMNTSLGFSVNPLSSTVGQQVVLTATLSPYTVQSGSTDGEIVTFYNQSTSLGTAALHSGVATLNLTTLPAGLSSLSAKYAGDTKFTTSTSPTISVDVQNTTALALQANPNATTYNSTVSLTATLSPNTSGGNSTDGELIYFYVDNALLQTTALSSGVATFTRSALIPVGPHTLTAKYGGDNYLALATSQSVPYTVNKAATSVSWTPPASATYTGKAFTGLLTASSTTSGTISYSVTPSGGSTSPLLTTTVFPAGSYSLTATLTPTDSTDYASSWSTATFTVNPAALTIVPSTPTRVYGAANPGLNGSVTGNLNGDTFTVTGATTATTTSPVGTYQITYTVTGANLANYTYTPQTGALSVTQATPAITWATPSAITYGTALSAAQLNATTTVAGNITYQQTVGAILTAGSYILTANFTPTDTTNYKSSSTTVPLTVNRAPLIVTAVNPSRVYGAANPSLDGSVSGTVNGDSLALSGATTATSTSHPGAYPITYTLTGANAASYSFTPVTGSLTVTQAIATVTWATPSPVVYGTPLSANQLNASASIPGTFAYQPAAGTILGAGSNPITATFTPTDSADYQVIVTIVGVTITPANLTIVPANVSRIYGAANPNLNGSVTGNLNGDTFTVTGATTATAASAVGSYPISYTITGANLADYTYTPQTGTLTVTQAQPTLTWTTPSSIVYGTPLSSAQLNASASIPGTVAYAQAAGTVLPAGSTTLSAVFTPTDTVNYKTQTATVPLAVTKAPLTIAANNLNRTFGAANPAFIGTVAGGVNGDTFTETFSTNATAASIVGPYTIVPSVTGANIANYTVSAANGVLTVSQAGTATTFALSNSNLTMTATVASLTSGTPTGTVGFYVGQTLTGTGTLNNGVATFSMPSFPTGNVTLTAQYSGDANFTQSSSPSLFVLAVTPASTSLTVSTTGSVTDSIGLAVAPGYVGTVQFSCSGLPKGATCSFNPTSLAFTGSSSSANVVVTVQTGTTVAGMSQRSKGVDLASLLALPALLAMAFYRRKNAHALRGAVSMFLLLCGLGAGLIGCGGSSISGGSTTTTGSTPTLSGTSTLQVLATGSGGLSQSTTVTLNVQ